MTGWWLFERWRCFLHGHRKLSPTASYGGVLANGRVRDLHFCEACETNAWVERSLNATELHPSWEASQSQSQFPSNGAHSMLRGAIRQLIQLSAGTDVPSTHLVSTHNSVGYGYIGSPDGDVFFDAAAVKNRRFDQLAQSMTVEFVLDEAPYLRTSNVVVLPETAVS